MVQEANRVRLINVDEKIIFEANGNILAWSIDLAKHNSPGLAFFSNPEDFIQVGLWNHPTGTVLKSHTHSLHEKNSNRTSEAILVLSGSIHADIYDEANVLVASATLDSGELLVCLGGGHGYRILSENTKVLEIKNGPYFGPEIDRLQFEGQCKLCEID